MSRSTVANGLTVLLGLSGLVGLVALVGVAVLAGERLEAAAAESPLLVVGLFALGLATVGLVVALRRVDFTRSAAPQQGGVRWRPEAGRSRRRARTGPSRLTRSEAREILDVGLTADEAEIKRTYRERVADAHPDRGGDETSFKRLTAAYERLLRDD